MTAWLESKKDPKLPSGEHLDHCTSTVAFNLCIGLYSKRLIRFSELVDNSSGTPTLSLRQNYRRFWKELNLEMEYVHWLCSNRSYQKSKHLTSELLLSSFFPLSFLIRLLSSFSYRQPRPASSASPRRHRCVWGALPSSSTSTCGLRGRGGSRGSLQRPLLWRWPPMGPQGLFRERSVTGKLQLCGCQRFFNPVHFSNDKFLLCHCFCQLWPSMTTARTRRMSCPSWREPSSTSSRKTMTAGSKASAMASPDSSQETTSSRSCTMLTKKRRRRKKTPKNSTAVYREHVQMYAVQRLQSIELPFWLKCHGEFTNGFSFGGLVLAPSCCAPDKMKEKKISVAQKREGAEPFGDHGSVSLHCGPKGAENSLFATTVPSAVDSCTSKT